MKTIYVIIFRNELDEVFAKYTNDYYNHTSGYNGSTCLILSNPLVTGLGDENEFSIFIAITAKNLNFDNL
jgi:hypothetical protein